VEASLSIERIKSFLLAAEVTPLPPVNKYDDRVTNGGSGYVGASPSMDEAGGDASGLSNGPYTGIPAQDVDGYRPLTPSGSASGLGGGGGGGANGTENGFDGLDAGTPTVWKQPTLTRADSVNNERVLMRGADLQWDDGTPLLRDMHLGVRDGELCAVVGQTGSGKSGLLSSLIGEIEPTCGVVATRGSIAYVSQVAWIQNATLKDNILFGKPFDPVKVRGGGVRLLRV
jgi:ABC-type multidrug transport system fused ATPase/permease subunit